MKVTGILTRERSEEEKLRRHLYGDRGAKFSGGKIPKVDMGGVIGTVTTMITKDILLIEYEDIRIEQEPMNYVNCIHTNVGGGWETMWVLVLEVYEDNIIQ